MIYRNCACNYDQAILKHDDDDDDDDDGSHVNINDMELWKCNYF